MVRKNRTEMPLCVCPMCNRSTPVGKLYGGNKILYYCKDCYVEFSVKIDKKGQGFCEISYSYGVKVTPQRFQWSKAKKRWVKVIKTETKKVSK